MDFTGRLIGVTGRAYSGKDETAKTIRRSRGRARIIWFAEPIKNICRMVYDFSEEQLYGKDKDKPDERYPRTWPEHIVKSNRGELPQCFPLAFGTPAERQPPREIICSRCGKDIGESVCVDHLTMREAATTLGTEWARVRYPDTWTRLAFRRAEELLSGVRVVGKTDVNPLGTTGLGSWTLDLCDLVLIPDVRFPNEARQINALGGEVWRVRRAAAERRPIEHESEAHILTPEMDAEVSVEIENNVPFEMDAEATQAALVVLERQVREAL